MIEQGMETGSDRCATWRSLLTETPLPESADVGIELQRLVQERLTLETPAPQR